MRYTGAMKAVGVYYEIATKRLDDQLQSIDQLDAKAATVYAAATAILTIFTGLLSLASLPSDALLRALVIGMLVVAILVYFLLLRALYGAYRVSDWNFRPDAATLQKNCEIYDEDMMREWVADECTISFQENEPMIATKTAHLHTAAVSLPVEAILLVIAGGVTLFGK